MVKTGGLFVVINRRPSQIGAAIAADTNKYSICSKFPESESDILFDGDLKVHLMDG